MEGLEVELEQLHRDLDMTQLKPGWAKAEIWLGCLGVALGVVSPPSLSLGLSLISATCGLYLTLAGTRSLLYQSSNRQVAYIIARMAAAERHAAFEVSDN